MNDSIPRDKVEALRAKLDREAEASGYHLNPDVSFTMDLAEGLLVNEERFGYRSCPCRLATGDPESDLDIVCPCDYRDPDLTEYGACYCALYVSREVLDGKKELTPVPERRPPEGERGRPSSTGDRTSPGRVGSDVPVWRCRVCGYLCARGEAPEDCPICKASKERFEKFWE